MQRMTVAEAANVLGVTRDAVRKRIKRDSIEWETGPDGETYVFVDASATANDASATNADMSEDTSGHDDREKLIEFLYEQLEHEREVNRENRRIIAGLVQRIPAIEPPPETPSEPRESPVTSASRANRSSR